MRITKDTPIGELFHSEDELTHWGILGMKWGVRRYQNKDGSLTALGKQRAREAAASAALDLYNGHEKVKRAKEKLIAADKLGEEFFNNDDLQVEYKKRAAKAFNKKWNWGMTDEEIDAMDEDDYFLWDDWDQGDGNSFQLFVEDRGVDKKKYVKNCMDARKEYEEACAAAVDELLSKNEGRSLLELASYKDVSAETNRFLEELMDEEENKRNLWGFYNI